MNREAMMAEKSGPEPKNGSWTFTGRHMLICLIAFFGIVFAVNAYMMEVALSTHTGVVSDEPFRKGLKYNEQIAFAERQQTLGWSDEISLAEGGKTLVVTMSNKDKAPLPNLKITAVLGRPATVTEDEKLVLIEKAPGRYEAETALKGEGNFDAAIEVADAAKASEGVVYKSRKRLWLKP